MDEVHYGLFMMIYVGRVLSFAAPTARSGGFKTLSANRLLESSPGFIGMWDISFLLLSTHVEDVCTPQSGSCSATAGSISYFL